MGNIRTGSISVAFDATQYAMFGVKATRRYVDVLAFGAELRASLILCPVSGVYQELGTDPGSPAVGPHPYVPEPGQRITPLEQEGSRWVDNYGDAAEEEVAVHGHKGGELTGLLSGRPG